MKLNTKLILLIRYLAEMRGIVKLVRQVLELTSKNRQLDLLNFLLENVDVLDELDRPQIMAGIAPNGNLSDNAYRNYSSKLSQLLEETLAGIEMKDNPFVLKTFIANAYRRMGLDKQFFKAVGDGIKKGLPDDELERHLALARGNRMIFFHPKANLHVDKKYQQHFDDWYLNTMAVTGIVGLKYYCISIARKLIYGIEPQDELEKNLELFIAWLPKYVTDLLVVQLYLKGARAIQELTWESYLEFKALFIENVDEIYGEKSDLIVHLINVLIFTPWPQSKTHEYFKLLKLGVEKGYFVHENRYMAGHHFNNIVNVACKMNETAWAEAFVDKHLPFLHLDKDSLDNIKTLYTCLIDFTKGKYPEIMSKLKQLKYIDYTYGIHKYVLELKCFYESPLIREGYNLGTLTSSFETYLRRKLKDKKTPISLGLKRNNSNFIKMLKLLDSAPYEGLSKAYLTKKLSIFSGEIAERKWLEEKIDALSGSK